MRQAHRGGRAGDDAAAEAEGDECAEAADYQRDQPEHGGLGPHHGQPSGDRRKCRADHAGRVLARRDQHAEHAQSQLSEVRTEEGQAHRCRIGEVPVHVAGVDPRLVAARGDQAEGHQEQQTEAQGDPRRAQGPQLGPFEGEHAPSGHPVCGAGGGGPGCLGGCGEGAHADLPRVSIPVVEPWYSTASLVRSM
ncbi:hypothetical protein STRTUCAR8_08699, partial [Streptomyces turgidiscabies Car8]